MDQVWANRAASAEAAVRARHLKRLWGMPGTQLGVVAWPPVRKYRWFGVWHYWWQAHLLDCLVDAQLRDPRPRTTAGHRATDPGTSAAQQLLLGQRLLRRHGMVGAGARARGPARRRGAPQGIGQAVRAVPQRVGARGRRRHPVAQTGPVLQRAGQRARRDLPGALRPAAARAADGGLDRRDADRPRDPPGVRRHQGRLAGARAVHLLPGRGARDWRPSSRRAPRTPTTPSGCTGWSPRCATTWRPTASSRAPVAATAACSTGSWRGISRWS